MSARRFAELFAGAGGLSMGLERAGWECSWHAEIAEAPRAILRHRWPDTPLYGDVTTLDGRALVAEHGPIDLLTGGSPCQDLSVAGKRAGLGGDRSSLFFEQMRLWEETGADLCLWENVDGARSSNNGKDFGAVLRAFVGAAVAVPSDGWRSAGVAAGPTGVAAWRVLDAQFFGVPQRRRRVFVLGTRTGSVDPAEVLSLAEGLPWDSQTGREAREEAADDARSRVAFSLGSHAGAAEGSVSNESHASGGPVGMGIGEELANSLRAGRVQSVVDVMAFDHAAGVVEPMTVYDNLSPPIRSANTRQPAVLAFDQHNQTVGDVVPTVRTNGQNSGAPVIAFDERNVTCPTNRSNPQPGDPHHTLHDPARSIVVPIQEVGKRTGVSTTDVRAGIGIGEGGDPMYTLQASAQHGVVAFNETGHEKWTEEEIAGSLNAHEAREAHTMVVGTLDARATGGGFPGSDGAMSGHVQAPTGIPRRLTPRECERLMSWPDDHTLVPDAKGKPLSDAARYKACGNGVASVHSHWIGWRLRLALRGVA